MSKFKSFIVYIFAGLCLFIFQFIYHQYSHGVISKELQYVWLYPLVLLAILLMLDFFIDVWNHRLALNLVNSGIAALVMKNSLIGILDIAGSDSPYLYVYNIVGFGFVIIGFLLLFLPLPQKTKGQLQ